MSRAERWWRPAPPRNVRPAVRATRRQRPTGRAEAWESGYRAGRADDTTQEQRDQWEQLRRLVDAADAAEQGDMGPLDDFLGVADAAGVTPLPEVDGDQLAADVERWLRGQDG